MVESYLDILGVNHTASLNDVKKAYRQRAKELHPDMNKAPDAHEKFISLNEAYEFLLDNWIYIKPHQQKTKEEREAEYQREKDYREWLYKESLRIRKKAEEMSKMKFEEFKKTKVYRTTSMLSSIADYFALVFGVSIIMGTLGGILSHAKHGEIRSNIIAAFFTIPAGIMMVVYMILHMRKTKAKN